MAAGCPRRIQGDGVKQGAAVIDVGINRQDKGPLAREVEFDAARQRAGWIAPVQGGVGPRTVALLIHSAAVAAERRLAAADAAVQAVAPA